MSLVSPRRLVIAAAATAAALASTAGPVMASDGAAHCPPGPVSSPFLAWNDPADYQLAPAGDVEDGGSSWSLTGGARAQEDNETFMVTSAADRLSLRLPGSSSATTPRMCLGAEHPTFRFFAKRTGGSAAGRLGVEVVYSGGDGAERSVQAGFVDATDTWQPSQSLPTTIDAIAAEQGHAIDASFRFHAQGGGVWSIDDVYVDPHRIG
jgi:hypothetical protein